METEAMDESQTNLTYFNTFGSDDKETVKLIYFPLLSLIILYVSPLIENEDMEIYPPLMISEFPLINEELLTLKSYAVNDAEFVARVMSIFAALSEPYLSS